MLQLVFDPVDNFVSTGQVGQEVQHLSVDSLKRKGHYTLLRYSGLFHPARPVRNLPMFTPSIIFTSMRSIGDSRPEQPISNGVY